VLLFFVCSKADLIFIIELPPNDTTRFNARATTATYNEPKIGILKRDDVSAPKWFVYSTIKIPENSRNYKLHHNLFLPLK
jgi:hypothetical protein